jgi:hypothetical protein
VGEEPGVEALLFRAMDSELKHTSIPVALAMAEQQQRQKQIPYGDDSKKAKAQAG